MLTYKVNLLGGSLTSIVYNGRERLYQPREGSWQGQDVVIFPFIARLKDKTYTYNGNTYSLRNHGLARYNTFELLEHTPTSDVFVFRSNEETLKEYPFDFELTVKYEVVDDDKLVVTYIVKNTGDKEMPFGLGAHPAIKVPYENDDTKGTKVEFELGMDIQRMVLDETGSFIVGEENLGTHRQFELDKAFFHKYKTFIMRTSEYLCSCILHMPNGNRVYYSFDCDYLAFWSLPTGDYVCVEPWMSLPDFDDENKDIMKKKSLIHLMPNESYSFSYRMRFFDKEGYEAPVFFESTDIYNCFGTYQDYQEMKVLSIPEGVKKIDMNALASYKGPFVILPSTIEEIWNGAFDSETRKKAIFIPKSIQAISPRGLGMVDEVWLEGEVLDTFEVESGEAEVENYEMDFHRGGVTNSHMSYKNSWINEDAKIKTHKTLEEFKKHFNI